MSDYETRVKKLESKLPKPVPPTPPLTQAEIKRAAGQNFEALAKGLRPTGPCPPLEAIMPLGLDKGREIIAAAERFLQQHREAIANHLAQQPRLNRFPAANDRMSEQRDRSFRPSYIGDPRGPSSPELLEVPRQSRDRAILQLKTAGWTLPELAQVYGLKVIEISFIIYRCCTKSHADFSEPRAAATHISRKQLELPQSPAKPKGRVLSSPWLRVGPCRDSRRLGHPLS
jgi:hypothetical protein